VDMSKIHNGEEKMFSSRGRAIKKKEVKDDDFYYLSIKTTS